MLAATAALAPLAILSVVYLRLTWMEDSPPLGLVALGLAFAFLAAARAFRRRDAENSNDRLALGVMAAATLAALALGLTFTLDRGMLTVALALSALGAAFVESRLAVPALRHAVAAMGFVVAARLAWDPRIVGDDLGTRPIFNWLLVGYGVPALSFGLAARLLARNGGEDRATQIAETLAVVFSALLVFFQIRHALHGGDPFVDDAGLVEYGLYAISALGFSLVLSRLDLARASPVLNVFSLAFGVLSTLIACLALAFWANPFFDQRPVIGGRWLNSLLLGYAVPGLSAAALANLCRSYRPLWFLRMLRLVALLLVFLYVTLETRRHFQGLWIGWTQSGQPDRTLRLFGGLAGFGRGVARLWAGAAFAGGARRLGGGDRAGRAQGVFLRPRLSGRRAARLFLHRARRGADRDRPRLSEAGVPAEEDAVNGA